MESSFKDCRADHEANAGGLSVLKDRGLWGGREPRGLPEWSALLPRPDPIPLLLPIPRPQLIADMRDALPAERVASLV